MINSELTPKEREAAEAAFKEYMGGGASSLKWYNIKLSAWLDGAAFMKDYLIKQEPIAICSKDQTPY